MTISNFDKKKMVANSWRRRRRRLHKVMAFFFALSSKKTIQRDSFIWIPKRHRSLFTSRIITSSPVVVVIVPSFPTRSLRISPSIFLSTVPSCPKIIGPPRGGSPSRILRIMSSTANDNDDTGSSLIRSKKQELRKQVRSRLNALNKDEIVTQSEKVWNRLFLLPEYQAAKSVGIFLSMPSGEICTDLALQACVDANKDIYVPQVGQNFENADMELVKVLYDKTTSTTTATTTPDNKILLFHHSWPRNKWGIPEPPADMPIQAAKPGDIDLLIVPGLAFDRNGNRLGQGKGYYDRFIARMTMTTSSSSSTSVSQRRHLPLVAVALDCQMVESVPVQAYDQTMDRILLPFEEINISSKP